MLFVESFSSNFKEAVIGEHILIIHQTLLVGLYTRLEKSFQVLAFKGNSCIFCGGDWDVHFHYLVFIIDLNTSCLKIYFDQSLMERSKR